MSNAIPRHLRGLLKIKVLTSAAQNIKTSRSTHVILFPIMTVLCCAKKGVIHSYLNVKSTLEVCAAYLRLQKFR